MAKYLVEYNVKHFETYEVLATFSTVVAARGWQHAYSKSEKLAIEYFQSVLGNYHQGNYRQNIWSERHTRLLDETSPVPTGNVPNLKRAPRPANRRGSALNI